MNRVETSIEPLRRTTAAGARLVRPPQIEAEIRRALAASPDVLRRRAERVPPAEGAWSSECLVHLIRAELRQRSGRCRNGADRLAFLLPALLRRTAVSVRRGLGGLCGLDLDDVTQQVLDALVDRLLDPGDRADFFEVRFALALKRLRIEICRRSRPPSASVDDTPAAIMARNAVLPGPWPRVAADPEQPAIVRQLIDRLPKAEREVWVLRHVMGYRINGRDGGHDGGGGETTLVERLAVCERTVRNRLRRAEARLAALAAPTDVRREATA